MFAAGFAHRRSNGTQQGTDVAGRSQPAGRNARASDGRWPQSATHSQLEHIPAGSVRRRTTAPRCPRDAVKRPSTPWTSDRLTTIMFTNGVTAFVSTREGRIRPGRGGNHMSLDREFFKAAILAELEAWANGR
jgi:hypothetical protein